MITIKNAATAQLEEIACNPHSARISPSKRIRTVNGHRDLMGFVMSAILSRL
jgi:hypothetical protein